MRDIWWVAVVGAGAVLVLDTIGAIGALRLGFRYERLMPVSFALYALAGALVVRAGGSPADGAAVGAVLGLVDATLGWAISWWLGPGRPPAGAGAFGVVAAALVLVPLTAAALGWVGAHLFGIATGLIN